MSGRKRELILDQAFVLAKVELQVLLAAGCQITKSTVARSLDDIDWDRDDDENNTDGNSDGTTSDKNIPEPGRSYHVKVIGFCTIATIVEAIKAQLASAGQCPSRLQRDYFRLVDTLAYTLAQINQFGALVTSDGQQRPYRDLNPQSTPDIYVYNEYETIPYGEASTRKYLLKTLVIRPGGLLTGIRINRLGTYELVWDGTAAGNALKTTHLAALVRQRTSVPRPDADSDEILFKIATPTLLRALLLGLKDTNQTLEP